MDEQGVFINVAAYYWQRECDLTLTSLKQRLSNASPTLMKLIEVGIIKHNVGTDKVSIKFLDEQWDELAALHEVRVNAGRKGGKAKLKPTLSKAKADPKHIDKDKEEDKDIKSTSDLSLFERYVMFINKTLGKNFRGNKKIKASFDARIKEGYRTEDFKKAIIAGRDDSFHKENQYKYLTPEFFTRADKLDMFSNRAPSTHAPAVNQRGYTDDQILSGDVKAEDFNWLRSTTGMDIRSRILKQRELAG